MVLLPFPTVCSFADLLPVPIYPEGIRTQHHQTLLYFNSGLHPEVDRPVPPGGFSSQKASCGVPGVCPFGRWSVPPLQPEDHSRTLGGLGTLAGGLTPASVLRSRRNQIQTSRPCAPVPSFTAWALIALTVALNDLSSFAAFEASIPCGNQHPPSTSKSYLWGSQRDVCDKHSVTTLRRHPFLDPSIDQQKQDFGGRRGIDGFETC